MNRTNTNNVNKTRDLLQTSGGKDEPNKHKQRKQDTRPLTNTGGKDEPNKHK